MRAAVHADYGLPEEVIAVAAAPLPVLKPKQVLVRMCAAGVNWADQSMTLGEPLLMRLGYGFRRPRAGIRGMEVAGVIEAVGVKVTDWKAGDEVIGWGTGTFAEFVAIDAKRLVAKSEALTFDRAAGLPVAGCTALQAMRDVAKVQPGDQVLVVGASGGIGSFAVQIAKAMGAEVTGVCSTPNIESVRSLGADRVIDYTDRDFTEEDRKYDAILDIADKHSLSERRSALKAKGTIIPNSGEGGRWLGSIGRILKARIISPFVSHRLRPFLSVTKRADVAALVDMAVAGTLTPVVGVTYPLDQAGEAVAEAGSGHARGKVILTA
ncbi:MAG: NAD(P)-dependent alcohol dehydrogenase [Acidimicrobiia bacterium]|nr:NAD(P)-dependent alcohol dehydrogenase [Acidimicrobiia bacterium]